MSIKDLHSAEALIHEHSKERSLHDRRLEVDHSIQLQRLSDKVEEHEEKFDKIDAVTEAMSKSLQGINSNMAAVKWCVIGCAIMLCVNQFGLITTIKLWFKL